MKPDKLRLRAVGTKLIHDHKALDAGVYRYIGRKWDNNLKGWPATDEPSAVEPLPEYVMAVKVGDLAPADQETADYCGVPFIPAQKSVGETVKTSNNPAYTGKI